MGAIAVIRVAGPEAQAIVRSVFRRGSGRVGLTADANRLWRGRLFDGDEEVDDVLVAPHSTKGGDINVVDISAHGGMRVVARILLALERRGAIVHSTDDEFDTPCWPASNQIEVEADLALARARTRRAVEFLATQRSCLPSHLENIAEQAVRDPQAAVECLRALLERWTGNRHLINGAQVAVLGPPNAGKSTLTNRLVGRHAVLASPQAGTTRDWTSHETAIEGVPISVIDTAGVYDASGPLDAEAVERGLGRSAHADLHLVVLDGSEPFAGAFLDRIVRDLEPHRLLVAVNKIDLPPAWDRNRVAPFDPKGVVTLSALTGEGVERMRQEVITLLGLTEAKADSPSLFTSRQARLASEVLTGWPNSAEKLAGAIRSLIG